MTESKSVRQFSKPNYFHQHYETPVTSSNNLILPEHILQANETLLLTFNQNWSPIQMKNFFLNSKETFLHNQLKSKLNQGDHQKKIKSYFYTDDVELPSKEQLWQQKQKKRNAIETEPHVKAGSHCHTNDKCTNTPMHNMEPFNKLPHILIEEDANPVVLSFNRQMLELSFDEQILATNARYIHFLNKQRIIFREEICTDNTTTTSMKLAIYKYYIQCN